MVSLYPHFGRRTRVLLYGGNKFLAGPPELRPAPSFVRNILRRQLYFPV